MNILYFFFFFVVSLMNLGHICKAAYRRGELQKTDYTSSQLYEWYHISEFDLYSWNYREILPSSSMEWKGVSIRAGNPLLQCYCFLNVGTEGPGKDFFEGSVIYSWKIEQVWGLRKFCNKNLPVLQLIFSTMVMLIKINFFNLF